MTEQKKNLRSCPFCGAAEFGNKGPSLRISSTSKGHFAVLCRCGAMGPMRDSETRAIAAWNTRNDSERQSIEYSFNLSETNDPPTLKGNLKSLDFPVILQILSSANKTGVLHLFQGQEVRKIYFRDGKIVAANGREAPRLGQIGCGKGIISQEQLQNALVEVKKTERQMGEVLLALQYITEDGLKKLVRHQIREIVLEIFLWANGNFEYRDYPVTFNEQGSEHIDTIRIILEAAARKDEGATA
jgi:Lar family restriction alleviation protein